MNERAVRCITIKTRKFSAMTSALTYQAQQGENLEYLHDLEKVSSYAFNAK